ncbi:ABC transporter permease [Microbacterium elymi]|uniref:ABC transporter permease subunit n=1 Tax=Microbacterium elymi TaxID=2909587 RepID=A0ABY5NHL5_9MICO|nr:ABC transporter permease subunit [Microbacterium elymi]UUT34643.1 ABC transporter permease subunit [Microbacterium elymi]
MTASTARPLATRRRASAGRQNLAGWLFVGPFGIVFLALLVLPIGFALYLSLFQKSLIGGTRFVFLGNYLKAFSDPSFLSGVWFVVRFSLVLIPLQMAVSLAIALMLDIAVSRFARFSRLMIFMPYAIPTVIGALMWGFLYSKNFGPLAELFETFGATAPDFLSRSLIFYGLLNVVTWQWAGYYMIILYAALQGIDPTLYEAARIDGASQWQIVLRIKIPLLTPALADPRVRADRHAAVLQRAEDPAAAGRRRDPGRLHAQHVRVSAGLLAGQLQLRVGDLVRAGCGGLHLRLHLPVRHPQARELLLMTVTPMELTGTGSKPDQSRARAQRIRPRGRIPLNIVLAFLMIYFLIPFWWVIVNSSKTSAGLFGGGGALWFADDINYWGNLVDLFTYNGGLYARWLANSAVYALVGGVGATVLAVLAGYGFAKYRFAGRRAAFAILLGSVMVPMTALVIPTFVLFAQVGWTNTIWAVIFPTLLNPFGVYLMNVYARDAVPDELLDAARVDGAGEFRTFLQVALPMRCARPS